MKRFAAIAVIAALVLTMSVGTAFAATCVGMSCSSSRWRCADTAAKSCPMDAPSASLHSGCHTPPQKDVKDAVGVQPVLDQALPASPLVAPDPTAVFRTVVTSAHADARGAPHLTSVIRI